LLKTTVSQWNFCQKLFSKLLVNIKIKIHIALTA
jgi:hypothetical protein